MYSDNGTNLTSGEREFKAGLDRLNQTAIKNELGRPKYRMDISAAPHFGEAWESQIKFANGVLFFVPQDHGFPEEVLFSIIIKVESNMNDRPIGRCSTDPNDFAAHTPNHLLTLTFPPTRCTSQTQIPGSDTGTRKLLRATSGEGEPLRWCLPSWKGRNGMSIVASFKSWGFCPCRRSKYYKRKVVFSYADQVYPGKDRIPSLALVWNK